MPFRKISDDVKIAAVRLYERELLPLPEILRIVGFSRATFFRVLKNLEEYGSVSKPHSQASGRPRLLHREDVEYLLALLHHRPGFFLDKLQHLLEENRFLTAHIIVIHRELKRHGISTKQLSKAAAERSALLRASYFLQMGQYTVDQLMFTDETSKDDRTTARRFGRSLKGTRAPTTGVFVRGIRYTLLPALSADGMFASRVVQGSVTRRIFLDFLETQLLPLSTPFPGPRSVLVLDNARIHHGEEVAELCARFGVRLAFLPPYSPDYNPIEEAFSKIKAHIRREGCPTPFDLLMAADIITASDAIGYITHSGYS